MMKKLKGLMMFAGYSTLLEGMVVAAVPGTIKRAIRMNQVSEFYPKVTRYVESISDNKARLFGVGEALLGWTLLRTLRRRPKRAV